MTADTDKKTMVDIRQNIVASTLEVTNYLYDNVIGEPGKEVEYRTADLATALDLNAASADDRCSELMLLGILSREIHYGKRDPDGTYHIGRYAMWELHMPKDEAIAKVAEWGKKLLAGEVVSIAGKRMQSHAEAKKAGRDGKPKTKAKDPTNYRNQPSVAPGGPVERTYNPPQRGWKNDTVTTAANTVTAEVTLATDLVEDTRAIAGPDKPSAFEPLRSLRKASDADALIEAARQYANRGGQMDKHIASLQATAKELGIEIDSAALAASIRLSKDDRLETIALVLPVIDRLEATVERLTVQNGDMRLKVGEIDQLRNDNRRLKGRVETLVSERIVNQQRAAN